MTDGAKKAKPEAAPKAKAGGKGGKKSQKMGRNKDKCHAYRTAQLREKHKVIKVAKSSGVTAALKYATERGILAFAQKRLANYKRAANPKRPVSVYVSE